MADREEQLHDALGLGEPDEVRELPAPRRAVLEPQYRTTRTTGHTGLTGPTGKEDH